MEEQGSRIVGRVKRLRKDMGKATGGLAPEGWTQWGARKKDLQTRWSQRRAGPWVRVWSKKGRSLVLLRL